MKVCLMVFSSLLLSACLLAVTKMRKAELEKDEKQRTFLDIKLRVTLDLWSEYLRQIEEMNKKIEELEALEKSHLNEMKGIEGKTGSVKSLILECTGRQKTSADELATANTELSYRTADYKKEVAGWDKEKADLKQKLTQQSLVCDFLRPNAEAVRKFCGNKVIGLPPKQQPKA